MTIRDKFTTVRDEINTSLIEREPEVDAALVAMLTGEHCLFVGDPGTAKSLLSDTLVRWINGTSFSCQLNKFTQPDELFGPTSVNGLKADEFRRITDGMLPEADVAYIDEIFKASSAILNTMLQVLNERKFKNGKTTLDCPLKLAIASSNEWATGKELGALFDRFLIRREVKPVSTPDGIKRLAFDHNLVPALSDSLTTVELEAAQAEVASVTWKDTAQDAFLQISRQLTTEGIRIGDRRLRKAANICRATAWMDGEAEVTTEHFGILSDVLWGSPEDSNTSRQVIVDIAKPSSMVFATSLAQANEIMGQIDASDVKSLATAGGKLDALIKDAASKPNSDKLVGKLKSMVAQLQADVLKATVNV